MIQEFIEVIFRIVESAKNGFFLVVCSLSWTYYNFKHGVSDSLTCLNGKTAIVTGGNSGIGFMTTKLLASRGCKVIIACRSNATKERDEIIKETNNPNIIVKHLDLCQFTSVRQFAEDIKKNETKIDILINNAGIGYSEKTLTEDGLETVMQANYFGHFLLTHLLIDVLKAADNARIVFLTSGFSIHGGMRVKDLYPTIPPTTISLTNSYSTSKLLNILVAQEMAKRLDKFGIKVNAADPGLVRTPIFNVLEGPEEQKFFARNLIKICLFFFSADLNKAANTSFHLATSRDIGNGLSYFRCLPMWTPRILKNGDLCAEIWKETEKIVRLLPKERL